MSEDELRELSLQVAKKVLGLQGIGYYGPIPNQGGHPHLDYRLMTKDEANRAYFELWTGERGHRWTEEDAEGLEPKHWREGWGPVNLGDYAGDIADAWQVIAHIWARGYWYTLTGRRSGISCEFWRPQRLDDHACGRGATEPEAICRAALAWAEVEGAR